MKKSNIKKLNAIIGEMEALEARLSEVLDEEQGVYDDKSEKWQESEAGDRLQNQIAELESAIDSLQNANNEIGNLVASDE